MTRTFKIKLLISSVLFFSEIIYLFLESGFFKDENINVYFSAFKQVRLVFLITPFSSWAFSAFAMITLIHNKYIYFKPEKPNASNNIMNGLYNNKYNPGKSLPRWPNGDALKLVIGETHMKDGSRCDNPEWLVLDRKGLYTGLIVFGATGTGKTSACAYPFMEQLFGYKKTDRNEKIGGLILDVKGDFWIEASSILERNGRKDDLIVIEPGSGWYFNPVHYPALDAKIIAERLYSVLENINSNDARQDSFWKDKSINLLSNSLSVVRLSLGYVTLSDVYEIISNESALENILKLAGNIANQKTSEIKNTKKNPLTLIEKMEIEAEINEIKLISSYFKGGDFAGLDERTRGIIKSEALRVCSDFIKPRFMEAFCPPREKINFPGFREALDKGRVVVLNMPETKYGLTGKTIGIMLKLDYFRTVLNRVNEAIMDTSVNVSRPMLFICDEYQNYVTSGDIESDAEFFARCRQSKAINIMLTQSYSSLKLKLGSEEKLNSLIGNIRSSLWLSLSDDYSREKASRICDKEFKIKITENVTEQDEGASFNSYIGRLISDDNTISQGTTKTYEKMPSFDTDDFARLKLNQAVYMIHSGDKSVGPGIVYLHPIYKPKTSGYFD